MFCYKNLGKITNKQVYKELRTLKPSFKREIKQIICKDYSDRLFEGIIYLYSTNIIYQEMKSACSAS